MDRAHRIGQKQTVNVYRLLMKDSLEERVLGLQRFKIDVANAIVNEVCFLLCNLLLLNRLGEFLAECHVCDGDVLERNVELVGALEQIGANPVRHGFSLGDELCSIKLGDNGFEDFVSNGGEDPLVVVQTEILAIG